MSSSITWISELKLNRADISLLLCVLDAFGVTGWCSCVVCVDYFYLYGGANVFPRSQLVILGEGLPASDTQTGSFDDIIKEVVAVGNENTIISLRMVMQKKKIQNA